MASLTRTSLAKLASEKRRDARLLLAGGRWASAYYFYGLTVEVAIKAVIARGILAETVSERGFSNAFYSHKLTDLVGLAGLKDDLVARLGDAQFKGNWDVVQGWTVDARYEEIAKDRAEAIARAVDDRTNGVFKWLTSHW